jgi:esterase/lipase superfamily enzyme
MFLLAVVAGCDGESPPPVSFMTADAGGPDEEQMDGPSRTDILYVTNRARFDAGRAYLAIFVWPLGFLAAALAVPFLLVRALRPDLRWPVKGAKVVAWAAVLGSAVWAGSEATHLAELSKRLGVLYGGQRGSLEYGLCSVSFPPGHVSGDLERPSIIRLEFAEDEDKHVMVMSVDPIESGFFAEVVERARPGDGDAFVFIHGYNVSFEEGALRTAQIAHDLGFRGAPILFSWPSQGAYSKYRTDEDEAAWADTDLYRFLKELRAQEGLRRVHLIAHSMGNRVLSAALIGLKSEATFDEIVLAAPDVDAETFREDVRTHLHETGNITLYASSNDPALLASHKYYHGRPRAGEAGEGLIVLPPEVMETVDVSVVSNGHSYIGDNGGVLSDLRRMLNGERATVGRLGLVPEVRDGKRYWVLGLE